MADYYFECTLFSEKCEQYIEEDKCEDVCEKWGQCNCCYYVGSCPLEHNCCGKE